jgi:hypothetical protein
VTSQKTSRAVFSPPLCPLPFAEAMCCLLTANLRNNP